MSKKDYLSVLKLAILFTLTDLLVHIGDFKFIAAIFVALVIYYVIALGVFILATVIAKKLSRGAK